MDPEQVSHNITAKCTTCSKLPTDLAYPCTGGHLFCEQCYSHQPTCPVCAKPFEGCRNLIAEKPLQSSLDGNFGEIKAVPLCKMIGLKCDHEVTEGQLQDTIAHFLEHHQILERVVKFGVYFHLDKFSACTDSTVWNPVLFRCTPNKRRKESSWFALHAAMNTGIRSGLSVNLIRLPKGLEGPRKELPNAQFSVMGVLKEANMVWEARPIECFDRDADLLLHDDTPVRILMPDLKGICADWRQQGGIDMISIRVQLLFPSSKGRRSGLSSLPALTVKQVPVSSLKVPSQT